MAMTRRGFLGWLATGTVSACVLAKIPTAWIPEPVRRLAACEFMRDAFNAWVTERGGRYRDIPGKLRAGTALYEAYELEMVTNQRFAYPIYKGAPMDTTAALLFKGVPLWESAALQPWEFELEDGYSRATKRVSMRPTLLRRAA